MQNAQPNICQRKITNLCFKMWTMMNWWSLTNDYVSIFSAKKQIKIKIHLIFHYTDWKLKSFLFHCDLVLVWIFVWKSVPVHNVHYWQSTAHSELLIELVTYAKYFLCEFSVEYISLNSTPISINIDHLTIRIYFSIHLQLLDEKAYILCNTHRLTDCVLCRIEPFERN